MSTEVAEQAPPVFKPGPSARYYDDFTIGESWISPGRTITEADVVAFAGLTGDYNPIHTDEEFAKTTVFGGRILHGPAGFAIATGLESRLGIKDGTAIAFLGMTWDLRGPILIGDTIRVHEKVAAMRESKKPTQGLVTFDVSVVNQRGEVTQEGQWKVLMMRRPK
ncbi:acyl dehydratase [Rhodoligotrophos appendicifer]|uniref:MaoC/PaaZ C-terminal domain-containing protein n=1 Tax=Rhodoligotrophos appendicifer TaxID=987056 RepID=UPI001185E02D|nr:MaoC/PaaZ C-terminal domain-containing protein [Rhodoligotrophos appendicifer]